MGHHRADVPSPARAGSGTPNTPGRRAANVPVDSPSTTTTLQVADIQAEAAQARVRREAPGRGTRLARGGDARGRDRQRRPLQRPRRPGARRRWSPSTRPRRFETEDTARLTIDRSQPGARAGDVEHHHDLRQRPAPSSPASAAPSSTPAPAARCSRRCPRPRCSWASRPSPSASAACSRSTTRSRPAPRPRAPTHASALSGSSNIGKVSVASAATSSAVTRDRTRAGRRRRRRPARGRRRMARAVRAARIATSPTRPRPTPRSSRKDLWQYPLSIGQHHRRRSASTASGRATTPAWTSTATAATRSPR